MFPGVMHQVFRKNCTQESVVRTVPDNGGSKCVRIARHEKKKRISILVYLHSQSFQNCIVIVYLKRLGKLKRNIGKLPTHVALNDCRRVCIYDNER